MKLKAMFWVGLIAAAAGFVGLIDQAVAHNGTIAKTLFASSAVVVGLGMTYGSFARQPGSSLPVILTTDRIQAAEDFALEKVRDAMNALEALEKTLPQKTQALKADEAKFQQALTGLLKTVDTQETKPNA